MLSEIAVETVPNEEIKLQVTIGDFGARRNGRLEVLEVVRLDDASGMPTRVKYAYQAMYRKEKLFRYDRDPVSHPEMPEHRHSGTNDRRERCGRVTLNGVMQELWAEVNARDRP